MLGCLIAAEKNRGPNYQALGAWHRIQFCCNGAEVSRQKSQANVGWLGGRAFGRTIGCRSGVLVIPSASMAPKELFLVIVAYHTQGEAMAGEASRLPLQRGGWRCHNPPYHQGLTPAFCKLFLQIWDDSIPHPRHITNTAANAISCNNLHLLFALSSIPCAPHSAGGPQCSPSPVEMSEQDQVVLPFYQYAPTTLRSYQLHYSQYTTFCTSYHLSPLPVSESCLCKLAAAFALQSLSYITQLCDIPWDISLLKGAHAIIPYITIYM